MDVDTYLRQVKLENESIPDVVVADTPESSNDSSNGQGLLLEDSKATKQFNRLLHIDEEYQKLDSGFKLSDEELKYFRLLKTNIHHLYGIQNRREDSSMWNYALKIAEAPASAAEHREEVWRRLLDSTPPDMPELCRGGVNYGCTQECLHALGNLVCQSPGTPVAGRRAKWLFSLLLMLDELHAMSEGVSYELQRIRRALLRRCAALERAGSPGPAEELSQLRLLAGLISTHFNQR